MRSVARGRHTEVTHISAHGIWLLLGGLTLAFAVLAPGCFTAIRPHAIENSAVQRSSPLASATISVAGEYERDVEVAVDVLRRTGVFGAVVRDQGQRSDLSVKVLSSVDSIRCGTPQMATIFTLGLVPTGNAHHALLALEFSGQGTGDPVVIERDVFAQTTHGLWALFLRARKEWTRPNWGKDPAGLAVALRGDLLANEEDLVRLARSPVLSQGPRQVGSALAKHMIDHGVGVSTTRSYEVKKIDSDYFSEE